MDFVKSNERKEKVKHLAAKIIQNFYRHHLNRWRQGMAQVEEIKSMLHQASVRAGIAPFFSERTSEHVSNPIYIDASINDAQSQNKSSLRKGISFFRSRMDSNSVNTRSMTNQGRMYSKRFKGNSTSVLSILKRDIKKLKKIRLAVAEFEAQLPPSEHSQYDNPFVAVPGKLRVSPIEHRLAELEAYTKLLDVNMDVRIQEIESSLALHASSMEKMLHLVAKHVGVNEDDWLHLLHEIPTISKIRLNQTDVCRKV